MARDKGNGEETLVIARTWRGAVRREDRDAYAEYMQETGVAGYASTSGNRGVWMLRRDLDDVTEFVMFTLWDSMDAVRRFAGEDPEAAVFYADDDRFLVERDLRSHHFEVVAHAPGPGAEGGRPESEG
jgi:heme-degrading monooxygenase HmoA